MKLISIWGRKEISKDNDPKTWGWRVLENEISLHEAEREKNNI